MIFSKAHKTYTSWLKSASKTRYTFKIIRKHSIFPNYNLKQLRNTKLSGYFLNKTNWNNLTNIQKANRKQVTNALRQIRKGYSLKDVVKINGINKETIQKHLGNYLFKRKGKWQVRKTDRLQLKLMIFEKRMCARTIITTNSKDRQLIGKYFANVKLALRENNPYYLKQFKNKKIIDAYGKAHHFETDLDRLKMCEEAIEEPEYLEIYRNR
ncbi:hypothetical protein GW835_01040 [archaeon]|nr:hypothetical protein [archaeon]NCP79139.1 hypothetical protein [archaeon]NCP97915.1 hypothetical protein [archaeon]NCQ06906.1 hypothetical protein [archaeon]NCQ50702.1 hypothetical protein [archaeon]